MKYWLIETMDMYYGQQNYGVNMDPYAGMDQWNSGANNFNGGLIADGMLDQAMMGNANTANGGTMSSSNSADSSKEDGFFKKHMVALITSSFVLAVVIAFGVYFMRRQSSSQEKEQENGQDTTANTHSKQQESTQKIHNGGGENNLTIIPDVPGTLHAQHIKTIIQKAMSLLKSVNNAIVNNKSYDPIVLTSKCASAKTLVQVARTICSPGAIREITRINVNDFFEDIVKTMNMIK